jgi:hypothetical protein
MFDAQTVIFARDLATMKAGTNKAEIMAIIAITTKISTKLKPLFTFFIRGPNI